MRSGLTLLETNAQISQYGFRVSIPRRNCPQRPILLMPLPSYCFTRFLPSCASNYNRFPLPPEVGFRVRTAPAPNPAHPRPIFRLVVLNIPTQRRPLQPKEAVRGRHLQPLRRQRPEFGVVAQQQLRGWGVRLPAWEEG